jgi:predicted CoA-binding protein
MVSRAHSRSEEDVSAFVAAAAQLVWLQSGFYSQNLNHSLEVAGENKKPVPANRDGLLNAYDQQQ